MSKPTTEKIREKLYACRKCGTTSRQSTNHYGQTYSCGNFGLCPTCPPFERPTIWICQEKPPEGMDVAADWTGVTTVMKKIVPK